MDHLEFRIGSGDRTPGKAFAMAGVVGSGDLEVMLERDELHGACEAVVDTAIRGYDRLWERVLTDFVSRRRLANVRISINDGGATPAIVSLRLEQAAAELLDDGR